MTAKPTSIDAYLASVKEDRRAALEALRRRIHAIAPGLEECISYSMPAFRRNGHVVAGFLATAKGCSYFPFSGTTLDGMADELVGYDRTKSALHFDPRRGLPVALLRKLLRARIAETAPARARSTSGRAAKARATKKGREKRAELAAPER